MTAYYAIVSIETKQATASLGTLHVTWRKKRLCKVTFSKNSYPHGAVGQLLRRRFCNRTQLRQ